MENEGKSMTILGMLLILAGLAAVLALLWKITRPTETRNQNASGDTGGTGK
jgi:hypothetical protein